MIFIIKLHKTVHKCLTESSEFLNTVRVVSELGLYLVPFCAENRMQKD